MSRTISAVIEVVRSEPAGAFPQERGTPRKILYRAATGLVATATLLAAFSYLTTAPQAVENFRHVGYPQQLRVLLGIAKLSGAIVLLLPRLPTLKEWAYAGYTFMWIAAIVAHYLAGDGALVLLPIALLGALSISSKRARRRGAFTRPPLPSERAAERGHFEPCSGRT